MNLALSRLILLLLLFLPVSAHAVPLTLSSSNIAAGPATDGTITTRHGCLFDANGEPLTGTHSLTFSLYLDDQASDVVWTETLNVDLTTDGCHHVLLGEIAPIDESLLDQYPLYLGLSVDGHGDMTPRHEVVSVPYAIMTETSFNVRGGTVDATKVTTDSVVVGDMTIDGNGLSVDGTTIIDSAGNIDAPLVARDIACTALKVGVAAVTSKKAARNFVAMSGNSAELTARAGLCQFTVPPSILRLIDQASTH